jgi:hypothetical protein
MNLPFEKNFCVRLVYSPVKTGGTVPKNEKELIVTQ